MCLLFNSVYVKLVNVAKRLHATMAVSDEMQAVLGRDASIAVKAATYGST